MCVCVCVCVCVAVCVCARASVCVWGVRVQRDSHTRTGTAPHLDLSTDRPDPPGGLHRTATDGPGRPRRTA